MPDFADFSHEERFMQMYYMPPNTYQVVVGKLIFYVRYRGGGMWAAGRFVAKSPRAAAVRYAKAGGK